MFRQLNKLLRDFVCGDASIAAASHAASVILASCGPAGGQSSSGSTNFVDADCGADMLDELEAASTFAESGGLEGFTVADLPNGETCTTAAECASNFCKGGVCCQTACTGPCRLCLSGKCEVLAAPESENICNGNQFCNSQGECADAATNVAVGKHHTCILTQAGTIRCWGENSRGQLGDGTRKSRQQHLNVAGATDGAIGIAAGDEHTCAVFSSGNLMCWGALEGAPGAMLGDALVPVTIAADGKPVSTVSSFKNRRCFVAGGGVWCWGMDASLSLSEGSKVLAQSPQAVAGLSGAATAVALGDSAMCVLLSDGQLQCSGSPKHYSDSKASATKLQKTLPPLKLSPAAIALADWGGCAVTQQAALWCWGDFAAQGAPLSQSLSEDAVMVKPDFGVKDVFAGPKLMIAAHVTAVSSGGDSICALTDTGGVRCLGHNEFGQLGAVPSAKGSIDPSQITGLPASPVLVLAGGQGARRYAAVTEDGAVWVWGDNRDGYAGGMSTDFGVGPVEVTGLPEDIVELAAADFVTLARSANGAVYGWGVGNLGDGTGLQHAASAKLIVLPTIAATSIAAARTGACVTGANGALYCWGELGAFAPNQLKVGPADLPVLVTVAALRLVRFGWTGPTIFGYGVTQQGEALLWKGAGPTAVGPQLPKDVVTIGGHAFGLGLSQGDFACALTADGTVGCWGPGANAADTIGTASTWAGPLVVPAGLGAGTKALALFGGAGCAIGQTGAWWCWNPNINENTSADDCFACKAWPTEVPGSSGEWTTVAAGFGICAAKKFGGVKCLAANDVLLNGNPSQANAPVDVHNLATKFKKLTVGYRHACGVGFVGKVVCWGDPWARGNGGAKLALPKRVEGFGM